MAMARNRRLATDYATKCSSPHQLEIQRVRIVIDPWHEAQHPLLVLALGQEPGGGIVDDHVVG
jgi:hypothetical protein